MDVVTTSLEALKQRATNQQNQKSDIAAIEAFCVMVTKETEGVQIGSKLLATHYYCKNTHSKEFSTSCCPTCFAMWKYTDAGSLAMSGIYFEISQNKPRNEPIRGAIWGFITSLLLHIKSKSDRQTPSKSAERTELLKIRMEQPENNLQHIKQHSTKAKGNSLKEKEKGIDRTKNGKEREDFLKRNRYSQRGIDYLRQQWADVNALLEERDREIQGQIQNNKIREAKYNPRLERIRTVTRPAYLTKRREGCSQKLIARARCGNIQENNRYWLDQEERRCTLCGAEAGALKHLIDRCQKVKTTELKEEEILEGKKNERVENWLRLVDKQKREVSKEQTKE
ncbi:hypothetical protein M0802_012238 [Mischocyttarus mexicanus]|nr:hypothetical protein M0802_012238 [Mischocyttarus mexicanus]